MFPQSPAQWAYFLGSCGVKPNTAARFAEAFHAECTEDKLSAGERELDDLIAEALHESAMLERTSEDLNYRAPRIRELGALYGPGSRWARAAATADELAGHPDALAEVLYGGRFGNVHKGDGWRFRGRGFPMLTFADNYAHAAKLSGFPLLEFPELLEDPRVMVRVYVLWWEDRIRDEWLDNPERIRSTIQGGPAGKALGLDHTRKLASAARVALGTLA